jgi:M6 family metalloprotease-like protein
LLWATGVLAAVAITSSAHAAPSFPDFRIHRAAADTARSSVLLDRLASLRKEQDAGRVTQDVFMMPGGSLGIMRRGAGGRWVPSRPASSRRQEILRTGSLESLSHGELARASLGAHSFPGQDTVRILVLRIDFLHDRSGTQTTGDGKFDLTTGGADPPPVDAPPHNRAFYDSQMEAMRRYYSAETRGRLVIQWDVYPQADSAYHANDMADYGPWKISQDVFPLAYKMFQSFLAAADTQDTSIPWSKFDRIAIFHAGSDLQSDTRLDSPNDIPTFTIGLDSTLAIPVADSSFFVFGAAILPETANQDGNFAALNAVIAHEHGHNIFGWRDVYDVFSGFPVCGYWTLMDTGNLTGTTVVTGTGANQQSFFAIGIVPPLADPYQRHLAYDDVPREVETIGVDSLKSPLVEAKAIKVPLDSEEYLLLENRQGDLNGNGTLTLVRDSTTGVILGPGPEDPDEYDYLLPGYGVVAWQVDESVVGFDPPGARADGFFTLNGNPLRRGLHILEGDGLQDIGDFTSPYPLGSPLDPWFIGNGTRLAPDGRPKLLTNSGTNPHVVVDVLDSLKLSMSVRVTPDWRLPGWPIKARPPVGGLEPLVLAFTGGVGRRVVFAAGDSAIHAVKADGSDAILFQAPAPLSPVAEMIHPTLGPLAVAVYPDPAEINRGPWSTGGSWIVAVDGAGNMAPGFPMQIPGGADGHDWFTAGPLVVPGTTASAGLPRIVVGSRGGRILLVDSDGNWTVPDPSCFQSLAGTFDVTPIAISAMAAYHDPSGLRSYLAVADSMGNVAWGSDGICGRPPAEPPSTIATAPFPPGWQPTLLWAEMNNGASSTQSGLQVAFPEIVALDRKTGAGAIYATTTKLFDLHGLNAPLTKGAAVGDMDGDGFNEVVIATHDGRVGFWNLSGSATPGWPKGVDPEPFASFASPVVANLDASASPELVMATGSGRLLALDRNKAVLPGWPLGTGAGQEGSAALLDVNGDGQLELVIGDADSTLYAFEPGPAPVAGAVWPVWGGNPGRDFALVTVPTSGTIAGSDLVVSGTLKCYPNPAKRSPMTVAFQLTEPGQATLTIYDPSGRQIDRISQSALRSDNALIWDPSKAAPGMYLARLDIEASGKKETHVVQLGVLH